MYTRGIKASACRKGERGQVKKGGRTKKSWVKAEYSVYTIKYV